jgi:hypothetical protein
MVQIDKIEYFGRPNCYKLTNGTVDVIVTTDFGPRVICYRFVGGENILAELGPEKVMKTELGDWHPWGGHRLWHAPEDDPRSYSPDEDPVDIEVVDCNSVWLTQKVEPATGIEKEMVIRLADEGTDVSITHTLTNTNIWGIELAPWALTIVRGGGTAILPNEPFISHDDYLLPARPLAIWHFTNMSDPRWVFGDRFIQLKCIAELDDPQKIGAGNRVGWVGFLHEKTLFVKRFPFISGEEYPDFGSNCELYTEGSFMEVETLGPLTQLEPGESVDHVEHWSLFKGVEVGETESELDAAITPLVTTASERG